MTLPPVSSQKMRFVTGRDLLARVLLGTVVDREDDMRGRLQSDKLRVVVKVVRAGVVEAGSVGDAKDGAEAEGGLKAGLVGKGEGVFEICGKSL